MTFFDWADRHWLISALVLLILAEGFATWLARRRP